SVDRELRDESRVCGALDRDLDVCLNGDPRDGALGHVGASPHGDDGAGAVFATFETGPEVVVTQHREAGARAGPPVERDTHARARRHAGKRLAEHTGQGTQVARVFTRPDPQRALAARQCVGGGVRLPGPGRAGNSVYEVVASGDGAVQLLRAVRARILEHRLARAAVDSLAHQGPAVVAPCHRLEVHHAPEGPAVLEVEEPVAAVGRRHPGALVRPVHGSGSLLEHVAFFVRTKDIPRTEYGLPAGGDASGRGEDPVPPVALVELRALDRAPALDVGAVDHIVRRADRATQLSVDGN